jgi:arylsulfatase A-like enzyme
VLNRSFSMFVLLACVACAPKPSAQPAVLLISIDTLRPDHLGIYGYERDTSPAIDAWFEDGAVYERAFSTHATTPPSVTSLLTGRLPQEHRVRMFYQQITKRITTIPDLLPGSYQTAGFVGNGILSNEALGVGKRFGYFEDKVERAALYTQNVERSAESLTDAALRWLEEEHDPERPTFLWIHYMDPHSPYLPPETFEKRAFTHEAPVMVEADHLANNNIQRSEAEEGAKVDALISVDAYDEEIAYTDSQIGRLLEGWARIADPENSLSILTADHGESMLEHQIYFAHGYQVYDEVVRIPMLVRAPSVQPGLNERLVSLVDVLPTVLGFALIETPPSLSGVDLRKSTADPDRTVFAETTYIDSHWRAAWSGDQKWMLQTEIWSAEPIEGFQYDLLTDPDELNPRPWDVASLGATAILANMKSDPDPAGMPNDRRAKRKVGQANHAADLLRGQLEKLRALGYVDDE